MTSPADPSCVARPRSLLRSRLLLFTSAVLVNCLIAELVIRLLVPIRHVGPSFSEYDASYGRALKESFEAELITPEFRFKVTTNRLRMRGPEPVGEPSSGAVFLGDSFTFGFGVSDGEEYPALVRSALARETGIDPFPVVNFSISNNGNGRWLKFLRKEARQYRPRAIVLQVMDNDFGDNLGERLFELDESGNLCERPVPGPSALRRIQPVLEAIPGLSYSYGFGLLKQFAGIQRRWPGRAHAASTNEDEVQPEHPLDGLTYALLSEVLRVCRQHGWPVALAILQVDHSLRRDRLRALFEDAQVPIYRPPSKSERPDLYWEIDGHWNSRGHAEVAQVVAARLLAHPAFR